MNTQQYVNDGAAFLLENPVKAAAHPALHAGVAQAPIHLGIGGAPGFTVYQLTAQQERREMVIELGVDGINVARAKAGHEASNLRAYYLPWQANEAYYMTLGDQADYFFTAPMNGCAVFVAGNAAAPTVCHANFTLDEDVPNRYALRDRLYAALSPHIVGANHAQSLLPSFYLEPGGVRSSFTSVYGFRSPASGNWSFCYHSVFAATQPWANSNKIEVTVQIQNRPYFMTGPLWPNLVLPVWRWRIGHHLLEKIGL